MDKRYEDWIAHSAGNFALSCCEDLLRSLLAGWPRRSRSVLVLNAGSGTVGEVLWEAGFDVTCQDNEPARLAQARARLGKRADFVLGSPDHLPFDDCAFDYAVAMAALEFWSEPDAVLQEIARLTCNGVILIFPNAWSLFRLECALRHRDSFCAPARSLLVSPRTITSLTREIFPGCKTAWAAVLPATTATWGAGKLLEPLNRLPLPVPLGAFAGCRIDFGPLYTGTPLLLPAGSPVPSD